MDYFVLEQEERLAYSCNYEEAGFQGEEPFVTYLKFDKGDLLPDLLSGWRRGRLFLCLSDEMKQVVDPYVCLERAVPVFLTDWDYRGQRVYWNVMVEEVDCIKQEIFGDRRHLSFSRRPKPGSHFFRSVNGKREYAVVSLELAENLLRRQMYGLRLYPIGPCEREAGS